MRKTRLLLCIMLSATLYSVAAFAAETTTSPAADDTNSQESIMPASSIGGMDECPMHKGHKDKCTHKTNDSVQAHQKDCPIYKGKNDKCEHKNKVPCPYHPDNSKSHE